MKITFNTEDEKNTIKAEQLAQGKVLIEEQNHIVGYDENENEIREKALVFADAPPVPQKTLEERVTALEAEIAILKGGA